MFGRQLLRLQLKPHPRARISLRCLNDCYRAFYLQLRSPKVCDFFSLIHWLTRTLLLSSAAVTTIVPPASQGEWDAPSPNPNGTVTDTDNIVSTVYQVDQKSGADVANTPPDPPVPNTAVTAIDGSLTTAGSNGNSTSRRSFSELSSRQPSDYELVFSGTGTGPNDCDASIEGTAYLTYSLVSNSTYNVNDCLKKCDQVETCGKSRIFIINDSN